MFGQCGVGCVGGADSVAKGACRILRAFLDQRFHGAFGPPMVVVVKRIELVGLWSVRRVRPCFVSNHRRFMGLFGGCG